MWRPEAVSPEAPRSSLRAAEPWRWRSAGRGSWDTPPEDALIAGDHLTLGGRVIGTASGTARLVALVDGVPRAERMLAASRSGAARGRLGALVRSAWTMTVPTDDADAGAFLEVALLEERRRTSLGTRRLRRLTARTRGTAPVVNGHLEAPSPGTRVRPGSAMAVQGWVLFDTEPAESVELFVGAEASTPIRSAQPRLDLVDAPVAGRGRDARAIASGFADLFPIPPGWAGQTIGVHVRARSVDGDVWVSEPRAVTVEPEEDATGSMERGFVPAGTVLAHRSRSLRREADRVRLCAYTHSLNLGGGELYLQELLVRLARDHAFEVLVVSPSDGPLKAELEKTGIAVHVDTPPSLDVKRYLGCVDGLRALMAVWQADAVIVNTLGMFHAVDAALQDQRPVLWAIHESFSLETFGYLNWGERGLHPLVRDRWLHALSHAPTVFESDATLEVLRSQVPGLKGSVVRYGVDLEAIRAYRSEVDRDAERERLGFRPHDLVLLCMGVMQERKAQLNLAWAFGELARSAPNARLVMVGDHGSSYAQAVRALIERLRLTEVIGVEPIQRDIYRWYLVADVLVSASDIESLPRSMMEAMAFGRPVLAADVFGTSEIVVDGENGWLFRARSTSSLISGLKRVATCEPEVLQKMSARCEADSRQFDASSYASEYAARIRSDLNGQAESPLVDTSR